MANDKVISRPHYLFVQWRPKMGKDRGGSFKVFLQSTSMWPTHAQTERQTENTITIATGRILCNTCDVAWKLTTKITANVRRAKIFLVGMHAVPETNQSNNVFTELAAALCRIHWSMACQTCHKQKFCELPSKVLYLVITYTNSPPYYTSNQAGKREQIS